MLSCHYKNSYYKDKIDELVQERRNSSASAMELCLSCTKPSRWCHDRLMILIMEIHIHKDGLYIETGPWCFDGGITVEDCIYLSTGQF